MRRALFLAATLLIAGTASAGDLDDAAKTRVRALVRDLASDSDKTRAAAATSLAAVGADALPTAVAAAGDLKSDAAWSAFARAVGAMGEPALDAVERLRANWPDGTETRFARLERDVRAALDAALFAAVPESPKDVVAKIDEMSSELVAAGRFDYYHNPKIDAIAALGRPAIGECVRILRDYYGEETYASHSIAKLALAQIVTKEDVPLFGALVRDGRVAAAYAVCGIATPEASAVIADAVSRGLDHDLCLAIERRAPDERVGGALAKFIADAPADQASLVGAAARALGRAGAPDAAKSIQSFLSKTDDARVRARCFVGMARVGSPEGIEGLVTALEKPVDGETTQIVGAALNEASGRAFYVGQFDKETRQWRGNEAVASNEYRVWWNAMKSRATFDPATRKWRF